MANVQQRGSCAQFEDPSQREGSVAGSVGDAAEIDRTYVSSLERKKYSVSIDRLDKLAAQLGVAPHYLLMPELPPELTD